MFEGKEIDVGLGAYGTNSMFGPIVLTALFMPSDSHKRTMFRYDLMNTPSYSSETTREATQYTRILTLNYVELGYLVKSFDPESVSNIVQQELPDEQNLQEIAVRTYINFLKIIQKKLKFKVKLVYYRNNRCFGRATYEGLARVFPRINFVAHQEDDCLTVRNIANIAILFAN